MAFFFFMSGRPSPLSQLPHFSGTDKVCHAIAYGVLALLCLRALRIDGAPRAPFLAALIASIYGATDELHQYFVPSRSCELVDWLADTAGAVLAVCWTRSKGSDESTHPD